MRVWDITSGQAVATLRGHSSYDNAIAALDSQKVISSSNDGTLRIWNVIEGQMLKALDASTALNDALAVLPDSRRIVSCSYEALLVWDVETGQPLLTLRERSSPKTVVALDSKRVVSGSFDGWLCLWDVERGEKLDVVQGTLIR
jgi:WD40 repeat protein